MITKLCVTLTALCLLAVPLMSLADESPLLVAHRGLLLHAPENTLANFRACLELRLGFEFDVEETKDGHAVNVGIDGILTDYPLELAAVLKDQSQKREKQ
jgi:glycerophosphoryl diester phosphodiesterase